MNEQLKDLETALQTLVDYKKVNGKVKFYQEQDGAETFYVYTNKSDFKIKLTDLDLFISNLLKDIGYGREN